MNAQEHTTAEIAEKFASLSPAAMEQIQETIYALLFMEKNPDLAPATFKERAALAMEIGKVPQDIANAILADFPNQ